MADFNFSLPAFDYPGKPKPKVFKPFSTSAGKRLKKNYLDNRGNNLDPKVVSEIESFVQSGGNIPEMGGSATGAGAVVNRTAPPPPPPNVYDNPAPGIADPDEFKKAADHAKAEADRIAAEKAEAARKAAIQAELDRLGPEYTVERPQWEVSGYEVNPYEVAGMDSASMSAQNFNPYRRAALEDVGRTAASSLASAQDQLARTGGLSAADRMALASQMNRQKIEGRQSAMDDINMLESKNLYDTQAANVQALNRERFQEMQNQNLANRDVWAGKIDADRFLASSENERRRQMELERVKNERAKYDVDRARHLLGKQLDWGDFLAAGGPGGGGGGGGGGGDGGTLGQLSRDFGEGVQWDGPSGMSPPGWEIEGTWDSKDPTFMKAEAGDKWSWTNRLNPFKGIKNPF